MRKTKIIIYIAIALGLLAMIAYLSGYRLSANSAAREINDQAHFSPAVLVYDNHFKDTAIRVYQHEDWLSVMTLKRSFGFLWKAEGHDPKPVSTKALDPTIKLDDIIASLVLRSRWPEKLDDMVSLALYDNKPYTLTFGQWWAITQAMSPAQWKATDPKLTTGQRTLLMVMTNTQGGTISVYDDLQIYHTGFYLVVVQDPGSDSALRKYFMKASLIAPLTTQAVEAVKIAKMTEGFNQVIFAQGASDTAQIEPWNLDLVSLTPDQSKTIKSLLRIETWTPVDDGFYGDETFALTLIDENKVTYRFERSLGVLQINIFMRVEGRVIQNEYWSAPISIIEPIQRFIDAQQVIVAPSQDALNLQFSGAQLGYSDTMVIPAFFDQTEDPSFRFTLSASENDTLRGLLQVDSWNKLDSSLAIDQNLAFDSITVALFGTQAERLFIAQHTPSKALAIIEFKDHKEYYTMKPALLTAARSYLLTLFEPQAPVTRVR